MAFDDLNIFLFLLGMTSFPYNMLHHTYEVTEFHHIFMESTYGMNPFPLRNNFILQQCHKNNPALIQLLTFQYASFQNTFFKYLQQCLSTTEI